METNQSGHLNQQSNAKSHLVHKSLELPLNPPAANVNRNSQPQ